MAEVFRARQTGAGGFDRPVAVKRILPSFAADPSFKAMFEREVAICAKLTHANIVQVYASGERDGYLYLVMELVDGHNLARTLQTAVKNAHGMPPAFSAYVASEAAKGLAYAHDHADDDDVPMNIVHRDVSPQNIIVGFDGQVKVVDFGIAKAAGSTDLTAPGMVKGKVAYMSPEQVNGAPLDRRSDVFGLGIILWEMLAGRRLFQANNYTATSLRVLEMPVPAPSSVRPGVHAELDRIVSRAVERDLDRRYSSALELHQDLAAFMSAEHPSYLHTDAAAFMRATFELGDEPVTMMLTPSATPSVPLTAILTPQPAPQPTDRRWLGGLGAAALLVAAFVLWPSGGPPPIPPSDVSGLTAYFDASLLNTSGPVDSWIEAGPLRITATQDEEQRRPHFFEAADPEPAFVRFDGQDDFLRADALAKALRRAQGLTVIWVVRLRRHKIQYIWSIHGEDGDRDVARGGFGDDGGMRTMVLRGQNKWYPRSPPVAVAREVGIFSLVADASAVRMFAAGDEVSSQATQSPPPFIDATYFSLGQEYDDGGPADFFAGDLIAIVVYDRALTDEERRSVELYFESR